MPAKGFPRVHIGYVNLYKWYIHPQQCVSNGDAGVRVGGGIDNDKVRITAGLVDAVDQFVLRV